MITVIKQNEDVRKMKNIVLTETVRVDLRKDHRAYYHYFAVYGHTVTNNASLSAPISFGCTPPFFFLKRNIFIRSKWSCLRRNATKIWSEEEVKKTKRSRISFAGTTNWMHIAHRIGTLPAGWLVELCVLADPSNSVRRNSTQVFSFMCSVAYAGNQLLFMIIAVGAFFLLLFVAVAVIIGSWQIGEQLSQQMGFCSIADSVER